MTLQPDCIVTMLDYYDGPREGVATVNGQPHVYKSLWSDQPGQSDTLLLQPISAEVYELFMEDWAIWQRWDAAFEMDQTTVDTHPALPENQDRHIELQEILAPYLGIEEAKAHQAQYRFLPRTEPPPYRRWQPVPVEWIFLKRND